MENAEFFKKLMTLRVTTVAFAVFLTACGIFPEGTGNLNDPYPVGAIQIRAGNFIAGGVASGTVRILQTSVGSTGYILRLENFSTTANLPLNVIARGSAGDFSSPLRGPTGNQNYSFTASAGATWSSIDLAPPGTVTGSVASATLN